MFDCDIERAEINNPNFTPFRKDRQNGKEGRGSCIYMHKSIHATELKSLMIQFLFLLQLIHTLLC